LKDEVRYSDFDDLSFMQMAFGEAQKAAQRQEVPIGAVLVDQDQQVLGRAGNSPIGLVDPTAHAEILVLKQAGRAVDNYRLSGTTMYVSLEPCPMCMGAMVHARVARLVFGALDPKGGAAVSKYEIGQDGKLNHSILIEQGPLAEECSTLLKDFFKARRK